MKLKLVLSLVTVTVLMAACRRENESPVADVVKEWYVPFSATFSNPAAAGRTDSGTVHIELLEDRSLRYDFNINNLLSGDAMTGVTLNAGNAISNGAVVLNLLPRIGPKYVTGVVTQLRQSLYDSLLNNADLYFNVTSAMRTAGLMRGQLNNPVVLAADVQLTGSQEVPAVTTTATGIATIRVTSNRTVYSNVTISNLETNDAPTAAHIHVGAPGQNGPVLVPLASSAAEFGISKTTTITEADYNTLLSSRLYVNAHTVNFPNGKIRGQLK